MGSPEDEEQEAYPKVPDPKTFLLNTPLYEWYALPQETWPEYLQRLLYASGSGRTIDADCPSCEGSSIFRWDFTNRRYFQSTDAPPVGFWVTLKCQRDSSHELDFYFSIRDDPGAPPGVPR